MENVEVARILGEMADILELTGGNEFRVRAYRQAARMLDTLPQPVSELWRRGGLDELPSVGPRLAAKIGELVETGTCVEHDQLASRVPSGLLDLLRIEGVGPKTLAAAWHQLGVRDVGSLEAACRDGRLAKLPRLGAKRCHAILEAIARYRARAGRVPLHRALPAAESIVARLRKVPGVIRVEAAGSVRRRVETVGDIDILVASERPEPVTFAFVHLAEVEQVVAEGPTRSAVRLRGGLGVDLRVLPPSAFGAALHYFTGSKSHNIAVRTRAVRMGIKLSEYGVFDREGRRLAGENEEDVFRAVGLPWIPPEMREGAGEIEAAEGGTLPRLVEEGDLVGDLHVHTDDSSDAKSSLDELVAEAHRLGRRYLAVTDHSRSRPLGLDSAAVRAQAARVRAHSGEVRLLAGVEVDILPDGSLDLPEDVLAELDWVVAGVHSHFNEPADRMTARIVRALSSGVVDALAHPSTRRIGLRDPVAFDFERVLEAAAAHAVALEINAQPDRLDLADRACRQAAAAGVRLCIDSDAHHSSHLQNLRWGVWVARRGWLRAEQILNCARAAPRRARTLH